MRNEQGKGESGFGKSGIAVAVALLLAGCASPRVVQSVQPNDGQLSCEELQKEYAGAEQLRLAAESSPGSTGGQIITGFLFFPALLVGYDNVHTAVKAAEARKTHLTSIMSPKNCAVPSVEPATKAKGK